MDPYGTISVWCAVFNVDFGSGTFLEPPPTVPLPAAWWAGMVMLGVIGVTRAWRSGTLNIEQGTSERSEDPDALV